MQRPPTKLKRAVLMAPIVPGDERGVFLEFHRRDPLAGVCVLSEAADA